MKLIIKIYSCFIAIFAIPFGYFAKIPLHPWHYYYCAIFSSRVPFLFGDIFRQWFYYINLPEFGGGSRVMFGAVLQTNDCKVGSHVFIGNYSLISHAFIGNDSMIGPNVHIISGSKSHGSDRIDIPMRMQTGFDDYIYVGEDVWVGSNSCIMKNISKGCIVGAGSVLTKQFQEFDIIVGNPAKVIRNRIHKT